MKRYDQIGIRQAEVAQLIVLQCIFAQKESRNIIFQGGTAIRWFYGGLRFSEDLDFVTSLNSEAVAALTDASAESIRRQMAANFGSGNFSIKQKKSRSHSYRAFVQYVPSGQRGKISVKIEFERLSEGRKPQTTQIVMQSSPAIAWFLREGGYRTAGAGIIVNLETGNEILTDKMRALMERPYTKGRDFFDVWFLTRTMNLKVTAEELRNKLGMYEAPFRENTPANFYAGLDSLNNENRQRLIQEIHQDLARFLDADTLTLLEQNSFHDLLTSVQDVFRSLADVSNTPFPGLNSPFAGLNG